MNELIFKSDINLLFDIAASQALLQTVEKGLRKEAKCKREQSTIGTVTFLKVKITLLQY